MRRRILVSLLGLWLLPTVVMAQEAVPGAPASSSGAVLVEIVNFHCPRCRQVNDRYDDIVRAAKAAKTTFRIAPAAWEGQSLWPDRVYYAVRDLFPGAEPIIRDALFDGIQREGLKFEELPQVMSFLERRQLPQRIKATVPGFDMLAVADRAATDVTLLSEVKVGRLIDLSGASEVPVFVWVRDGKVLRTLSPADAPEPAALLQKVIHQLAEPLN